jgi:hypothetical protein
MIKLIKIGKLKKNKYVNTKMKIINNLLINYKSFLLYIILSTIICNGDMIKGVICFIFIYTISYTTHLLLHVDFFYCSQAIIHFKHHEYSESMLYFILNLMTEYYTFALCIVFKYILHDTQIVNLYFIDKWIVMFMYLIYTTVHNFNYGYLKHNNYHVKHHEKMHTNIGPDIFDLICNTKNNDTPTDENMDHYIPNTILAFIIVALFKYFYNEQLKSIFTLSFCCIVCILFISCILILNHQIDTLIDAEMTRFV